MRGANAALIVSRIAPCERKFVASVATRPSAANCARSAAEHVDVGMTEAVDRLLLVSDEEQVVAVERAEEVQLQGV